MRRGWEGEFFKGNGGVYRGSFENEARGVFEGVETRHLAAVRHV